MAEQMTLHDLQVGQLGEIVELQEDHGKHIFQTFGAAAGMSVVVLQKAAEWLVQIGYTQVTIGPEYLHRIKVRTV